MKIGISTYFNIKNYGSALQAFALRKVLSKLGYEAEFLNVKENSLVDSFFHKMHVGLVTLAKCIFFRDARKVQKEITELKKHTAKGIHPKTEIAFNTFQAENLPSINIGRRALKRKAQTDEYTAFICGSDQIWSPLSPHMSGYKFLNFAPQNKRIAYAPSFGVSKLPMYNKSFVEKHLKQMKSLSVREQAGAEIIRNLISVDVPVVLDPTMLLNGEEWRHLYQANSSHFQRSNYVLCYFFEEPTKKIVDKIVSFVNEHNLEIIVLFPFNDAFIKHGAEVVNVGPWDFLSLVDNADYVFTNSFHGCSFSILFKKEFIAFDRCHSDSVKQTSRIETLLKLVNAQTSFYREYNKEFSFPNVEMFDTLISEQRSASIEYLEKSLGG